MKALVVGFTRNHFLDLLTQKTASFNSSKSLAVKPSEGRPHEEVETDIIGVCLKYPTIYKHFKAVKQL
jgi:hypothetical protein